MGTSKTRVLVVDDEADMLVFLLELLRKGGFEADGATTGAEMHAALAREAYSLILLDLHLGSDDGLTLARELRERHAVPIIMLSGSSDVTDRVLLLEVAADDFVVKPFNPRELLARIRAVLRRYVAPNTASMPARQSLSRSPERNQLHFGCWVLDLTVRELVHSNGSTCDLTQAEFRLLEAFVHQPQRAWTRDQLIEQTRSIETDVFDRTIDVLILRLRRKIEPNPRHPQYICTERGKGYVFAAPVTRG